MVGVSRYATREGESVPIVDRQVAADDALAQDVGAMVSGIARGCGLRRRKNVSAVDLETGGPREPVVEFTSPFAFSPEDDRVRAHQVSEV